MFPPDIGDEGLVEEFNYKGNEDEIVLEESDKLIDICAPRPERNVLWKYLIGKHKDRGNFFR